MDPFVGCFVCGKAQNGQICSNHPMTSVDVHISTMRAGTIETLINALKFHNVKDAALSLAEILDDSTPLFPDGSIIVPVPTVTSHIRQRGYDHIGLISSGFGVLREMEVVPLIRRINSATQHIANKVTRERQSASAFELDERLLKSMRGRTVVLIDDIITTGSTISAASKLLVDVGFYVYIVALAYQPLD